MRAARPGAPLVAREIEILRAVAEGRSYHEIASDLVLAWATVRNYARSGMNKLGARNQAHAVHLAYQAGILRRERHGDHAGYAAHHYRGEQPCDLCVAGERKYRAAQRHNRRKETAA